ncbi:YeeE/YedE family protein [Rhodothermus bifroesti]|uniref:YeeE/YedE family protein n=1 Tax=Rhodothermus marinus TaxID=29549 RepID=A0A7V2B1I4_RHOMR|nr:YeeE/YedE thiosulfate transporter family protein [Rhodothermus bifroesti]GBD01561.1 hypothetical protein HRbin18_01287 [bacterium HR18]
MLSWLSQPWPWYVAGPLIGLIVPLLLLLGGKSFGVSANLRHLCAAILPSRQDFFRYDWKSQGLWNLTFALGIVLGGLIASTLLASPDPYVHIAEATRTELAALGISDFRGLVPSEFMSWQGLLTPAGLVMIVLGGFLIGFGARYAGGCTSGHAIMGLADLQLPSLVATIGFFIGGLIATHLILPLLLN